MYEDKGHQGTRKLQASIAATHANKIWHSKTEFHSVMGISSLPTSPADANPALASGLVPCRRHLWAVAGRNAPLSAIDPYSSDQAGFCSLYLRRMHVYYGEAEESGSVLCSATRLTAPATPTPHTTTQTSKQRLDCMMGAPGQAGPRDNSHN